MLAGDGPERLLAGSVAREEGVEDRVRFLGEQQDVERVLSCADLFLLPSEFESFGLAALEAMACGVPVISTRTGGLPEVIEHGSTGYLGAVGDLDGLAAASLDILSDPERHQAMSRAARGRAEDIFPQRRIVSIYEAYYEEVLESS